MLQIQVSGYANEGKSRLIAIIEKALKAEGKRVIAVDLDKPTQVNPGPVDVVIFEHNLPVTTSLRASGIEPKHFDFLVGLTESAAYELVQDSDFIARVVSRNDLRMVVTQDVRIDRVNLRIVNNTVVGWYIG